MPQTTDSERLVLVLAPSVMKTFRAVGGTTEYRAKAVTSWEALDDALEMAAPSTLAVVDPYDGRPPAEGLSPRVPELIRRHPMTPVVAAMALEDAAREDVAEVLAWGVSEVVDLDLENTPTALVPRLRGAHARPLKRRIEKLLSPYASTDAAVLLYAARWPWTAAAPRSWPSASAWSRARWPRGAAARRFRPRAGCWRGRASCWPRCCWKRPSAPC
jgi:hypothetical protein